MSTKKIDENEHSMELHMPFVCNIGFPNAQLIPIMIGEISDSNITKITDILQPYFDSNDSIFLISSDFCHWGSRFEYTTIVDKSVSISKSIEKLDRAGMKLIEEQNLEKFNQYLESTENTICGKNPIKLLLSLIETSQIQFRTSFIDYAQSGEIKNKNDSSVSYAAGVTYPC